MAWNDNTLRAVKNIIARSHLAKRNGGSVVGVGIGTKEIDGIDTGVDCVSVYVAQKTIDLEETAPSQLIPTEIAGVQTDVIDVGRNFSARTNVRKTPMSFESKPQVRPGSSIGPMVANAPNVNQALSGTLGAVLQSGAKRYVLSANHVLSVNGRVKADAAIYSPSPEDPVHHVQHDAREQIADAPLAVPLRRLTGANANRVDCAIAEIRDPLRVSALFPGDVRVTGPAQPVRGMRVFKHGKATGRTEGIIVDLASDIIVDYTFGTFHFTEQILVKSVDCQPFAADGDSGAVLVDCSSNRAVGLLFAPVGMLTAACPMDLVLDLLTQQLRAGSLQPDAVPPLTFAED